MYNFTIGIMALPAALLCGALWQHVSPVFALQFGGSLALLAALLLAMLPARDEEAPVAAS
jgi:hypothetical protein